MRLQLTNVECHWITELVRKAKAEAELACKETPHPLWELRRDNMADLENKINDALRRDIERNYER